jgi:hypothetical protein
MKRAKAPFRRDRVTNTLKVKGRFPSGCRTGHRKGFPRMLMSVFGVTFCWGVTFSPGRVGLGHGWRGGRRERRARLSRARSAAPAVRGVI